MGSVDICFFGGVGWDEFWGLLSHGGVFEGVMVGEEYMGFTFRGIERLRYKFS